VNISLNESFVMVFKRIKRDDLGEFSLDSQMLNVIMELDGKKTLAAIAEKMGMKMSAMKEAISKLLQLNLIEPVEGAVPMLDKDFFDYLNAQLTTAIGPIAHVLIEDAVIDLDHSVSQFPIHRAAELVDLLAQQIRREDRKADFKQNMIKKIVEKG